MLMDAGMDSGPILAQRKVDISSTDTTGTLTSKLARVGAALLIDILPQWLTGKLKPQPQDESQATYSKLISKEDAEIDWHLSAVELWWRIQAYNPWPGCYTWWKGKRLKIHEATPLGDMAKGKIGEVLALAKPAFRVGVITGHGILGLNQVQLEGKRKMAVDDFVRGQRDFIGSVLG
jgi:methionyl-tRNA formyltransferase